MPDPEPTALAMTEGSAVLLARQAASEKVAIDGLLVDALFEGFLQNGVEPLLARNAHSKVGLEPHRRTVVDLRHAEAKHEGGGGVGCLGALRRCGAAALALEGGHGRSVRVGSGGSLDPGSPEGVFVTMRGGLSALWVGSASHQAMEMARRC